jgi:hypothetical protein
MRLFVSLLWFIFALEARSQRNHGRGRTGPTPEKALCGQGLQEWCHAFNEIREMLQASVSMQN